MYNVTPPAILLVGFLKKGYKMRKIFAISMTFTMVTSMLVGCGTKEPVTNNADNTETFATTEVVEQNAYDVTTESESTESIDAEIESNENTEAEITKIDTAGSDFSAIAFNENSEAYFVSMPNTDQYAYQIYNATNNFYPEDSGDIAVLETYVDYCQENFGNEFYTDELIFAGDYPVIKSTGYELNEETGGKEIDKVVYSLPLKYNGLYTHNGLFSYVIITFWNTSRVNDDEIDENGNMTEQGLLNAIELLK